MRGARAAGRAGAGGRWLRQRSVRRCRSPIPLHRLRSWSSFPSCAEPARAGRAAGRRSTAAGNRVHLLPGWLRCRRAATARVGVRLTTRVEQQEIAAILERHVVGLSDGDLRALDYDVFAEGLSRGVAAHHAGMLPTFKECVEEAFVRGLIKVVFATETLALGINMPARSRGAGEAGEVRRRNPCRCHAG